MRALNFGLVTSLGDIDLLGEIPGGGTYDDLRGGAITLSVFGAPGRPRDLETLAEL